MSTEKAATAGIAELAIVQRLVQASLEGDTETVRQLLSPHFFARPADGKLYSGDQGFSQLVLERIKAYGEASVEGLEYRRLGRGVVLISGELIPVDPAGDTAPISGAWVVYVRDGRLHCLIYFGTETEALRSLPASARKPSPLELVEKAIAAFNRRDLATVIGMIPEDFRFTTRPGVPPEVGILALLELQVEMESKYESYVLEPHELTELGDGFVLVEGQVNTMAGAVVRSAERAILARVEDGMVSEWTHCVSAEDARERMQERLAPG